MWSILQTSSGLFGISSNLWSGMTKTSPVVAVPQTEWSFHSFTLFSSHKFGKKLTYVNYLAELRDHLNYEQLTIPPDVLKYGI